MTQTTYRQDRLHYAGTTTCGEMLSVLRQAGATILDGCPGVFCPQALRTRSYDVLTPAFLLNERGNPAAEAVEK